MACTLSLLALRLMVIYWQVRVARARLRSVVHVVPGSIEVWGRRFWYVVYLLGGVALCAGLWRMAA